MIERLLAAGAVVFGKTNLPLNAMDIQSYNALCAPPPTAAADLALLYHATAAPLPAPPSS